MSNHNLWKIKFSKIPKFVLIDPYEVREGLWGKFVITQSPYPLQNQKLDEKIFVKAVDKNGNARVELLYPQNFHPWYKTSQILGILNSDNSCCTFA